MPHEGAGIALCETTLPRARQIVEHAEINTEDIKSLKGFCFTCFHCLCTELQRADLWEIFERYQNVRDGIESLAEVILNAAASDFEKGEAFRLLEKFLHHPLIDSNLGGTQKLLGPYDR